MGEAPLDALNRKRRIAIDLLSEINSKLSEMESKIEAIYSLAADIDSFLSKYESSHSSASSK